MSAKDKSLRTGPCSGGSLGADSIIVCQATKFQNTKIHFKTSPFHFTGS